MKIAIVNDVHVGKPLIYRDQIRSYSNKVMDQFEGFLNKIVKRHNPDFFVNLGDLIRSEDAEIDTSRYRSLMKHYQSLNRPVIHLLGNHEIKRLKSIDIENVWKEFGFNQNSYGHRSINEIDIIWLGIAKKEDGSHTLFLPEDQLNWLAEILSKSNQPTVIFLHVPIDDHNMDGNFFYEALDDRKKDLLFLNNQDEIRKIIQSKNSVIAIFQAHLHYFHIQVLDKIPYITCPAMGDNICGYNDEHLPEIYTIVDIDNKKLTVKIYSNEFCFAGYEQPLLLK